MGNASKRKPPRATGGAPRPPTPPPRFAIVRGEYKGAVAKIDIYNLDHIVHVVSHVYGEERAIELWTLTPGADPFVLTGKAAADMLAHFILCGIDVEGAPEALASSRGEMYAPYLNAEPVELPEPDDDEAAPGPCAGCAFQFADHCAGWIPGGLDDACGAFEPAPPVSPNDRDDCAHVKGCEHWRRGLGCTVPDFTECPKLVERVEDSIKAAHAPALFPNGIAPPPTTYDTDGIRAGCDCPTCRQVKKEHEPKPPISVEEHAAELREIRERESGPALAIGEIRIGFADEAPSPSANAAKHWESTRASCAFGANCKRFPACGDCSLYALDRVCVQAHEGAYGPEEEKRVVHVEHVEAVSGETAAHLLERVERCTVFVGMKAAGVVPGDKWCGVGHEMTDPACALCPYLRIYAPPFGSV